MREALIVLAAFGGSFMVSASAGAAPAKLDDAATIRALEEEWERALLAGDDRLLQRILAPEFRLMGATQRGPNFTPRSEWFANLKNFKFDVFRTDVVDVVIAGNTAIATVEGNWRVKVAGQADRENRFILSDTWVKRGGRWAVVYRHATNLPKDNPPTATR
jgi:hypothetical protein